MVTSVALRPMEDRKPTALRYAMAILAGWRGFQMLPTGSTGTPRLLARGLRVLPDLVAAYIGLASAVIYALAALGERTAFRRGV